MDFDPSSKDYFVHLTNNAVQLNAKNYGDIAEGNIIPLSLFEVSRSKKLHVAELARSEGHPLPTFEGHFYKEIRRLVSQCLLAAGRLLNPEDYSRLFELFGFDLMIDEQYRVWIIECNSVPSLSESNGFLSRFLPRVFSSFISPQTICSKSPSINCFQHNRNKNISRF